MPNRILRDWTDSERIEHLSAEAERLFVRLLMKADDFGRYHADVRLIRAGCFPLLENLRDSDITHWLSELQPVLLVVYQVRGRSYLAIRNFRQRTRQEKGKFPPPENQPDDWLPPDDGGSRSIDGQLTVNGRSIDGLDGDGDGDVFGDGGADGAGENFQMGSGRREEEKIFALYPLQAGKRPALIEIRRAYTRVCRRGELDGWGYLRKKTEEYAAARKRAGPDNSRFTMQAEKFYRDSHFDDDPVAWGGGQDETEKALELLKARFK